MRRLMERRIRSLVITACLAALLVALYSWGDAALLRVDVYSGFLLLSGVWFLAMLHWRKKVPSLPLGNVATWLQIHIYVALLMMVTFALHVKWRIPNGWLEASVGLLFFSVSASGLFGLYLTRTLPKKLARVGEEIIYERIPYFRRMLVEEARQILLQVATVSDSPVLMNFYTLKLQPFLAQSRSWGYRLNPDSRRRRFLLAELQGLHRYLSEQERPACERLFAIVRRKDDLDYHEALQSVLRTWLFVHIALTYPLLLLATLHGLLAWSFVGALP